MTKNLKNKKRSLDVVKPSFIHLPFYVFLSTREDTNGQGFDYRMGGSVSVRDLPLRTTMRRMGIEVPPPEGEQALDDPTPPSVAPSSVSWDPEFQEEEDKRPGREKLFAKPEEAKGPETEEERRIRLTKEAMLANTNGSFQVFLQEKQERL